MFPKTKEFIKSCSIALAYNSYNYIIATTKCTALSSIMLCLYYTPEKVYYEGIVLLPSFPHCIKTVFVVNISKGSVLNLIAVAFTMGKLRENDLLLTTLLDSSCSQQSSIS